MSQNMPELSTGGAAWLNSLDLIHVYCGRRESEHPNGRFFGAGPCGFPKKEWPEVEFRRAPAEPVSGARERLAAALADDVLVPIERGPVLAALLPVVQQLMDEHAAAELEKAANDVWQNHGRASGTVERIRARVAALRAAT